MVSISSNIGFNPVCQEKGIDCYQLVINSSDYHLTREKLTEESIGFNETKELSYINLLVAHTSSLSEKMSNDSKAVVKAAEEGSLEVNSMINVLTSALDFLSDAYFLKTSFNRYCKHMNIQESEMRENEQIRTAISQIDGFVSVAKLGSDSINENARPEIKRPTAMLIFRYLFFWHARNP